MDDSTQIPRCVRSSLKERNRCNRTIDPSPNSRGFFFFRRIPVAGLSKFLARRELRCPSPTMLTEGNIVDN
ncbi:unnamed protein product [Cuscuta campestris]|uniref:Uncharacterized protein n=1 Tax=Cuscuta campestris TaxID=132261 RepID=A0A484KX67_9ASTE|nr:unnamed protein product [Cuscuta campestris]